MDTALELALLRVAVAPAFIGLISLIQLRLGNQTAGWLVALPINTGTIVAVLALTQGLTFAASTASGALSGVISVAAFVAGYALSARRLSWLPCLGLALAAFVFSTLILNAAPLTLPLGLFAALLSVVVVLPAVRSCGEGQSRGPAPRWEIPLRMFTAGCLVLGVTALSTTLGARLSGLIAPIPVFTITLVAFTHSREGVVPIFQFLRGLLNGMVGFAIFCVTTAILLPALGIVAAEAVGFAGFAAAYPLTERAFLILADSAHP